MQFGCVTNRYKIQAHQDMKDFVLDPYNRNGQYLLFFETKNKNRIIYSEAIELQYPLRRSPKFEGVNIESYFKDMMLGKIILSCGDIGECFDLTPKIIAEYRKKGVNELLSKYAKYDDDKDIICNRYYINYSLNYNDKLTIAYCLYLNNIYTLIDEYAGDFIAYKDLLCIPKEILDGDGLIEIEE